MQTRNFVVLQPQRQGDGTQLGTMQNFIRVGVADAAEKPRVRERPLQRVIGGAQDARELRAFATQVWPTLIL
jgi:hypothetical protein